jgi:hypothetical protein
MNSARRLAVILMALSFFLGVTPQSVAANSDISSAQAGIQLIATVPAQLKLSISEVNLDLRIADTSRDSGVIQLPVVSSWFLDSSTSKVELMGYFDSPASALVDNAGHAIPANHVVGGISGKEMLPFIEANQIGTVNASRTLFRQDVSPMNLVGSRTDTLQIQVSRIDDLELPPAEYHGVLHLRLISY